jgi:hypothetical protein
MAHSEPVPADRLRRREALEHYSVLAQRWDYDGWLRLQGTPASATAREPERSDGTLDSMLSGWELLLRDGDG